jgi:ABC-type cobalamin/Fe3+-siderophores transport system ATPase subunit
VQIDSITVKNFRCVSSETLNCGKLTALVGANGTGKSTFLKALDIFYDPSPRLEKRDWHNEDQSAPIEIAVTFNDLGESERRHFACLCHLGKGYNCTSRMGKSLRLSVTNTQLVSKEIAATMASGRCSARPFRLRSLTKFPASRPALRVSS